jgi:hypothetical protein
MHNGQSTLDAWKKFAAFEVFGDYAPMAGFRLVVKLGVRPDALHDMIRRRAPESTLLDPQLGRWIVRAGLGLVRSGLISFAYATAQECLVVVRLDAMGRPTDMQRSVISIENELLTLFTARLSLLLGRELPVVGQIYEFPDLRVIRRALTRLVEEIEETTPLRSSLWLGAQLRGRGEAFHPSMLETLEEQTSLLQANGIDMDALPSWWWRGVAAAVEANGEVEVFAEIPPGEDFGGLIPE